MSQPITSQSTTIPLPFLKSPKWYLALPLIHHKVLEFFVHTIYFFTIYLQAPFSDFKVFGRKKNS